jgi:hypothetical protein
MSLSAWLVFWGLIVTSGPAVADDGLAFLRDGFEGPKASWRREQTDTQVQLLAHERSDRFAHDGGMAERFQFVAGVGSGVYFSYPLPKVPLTKEVVASVQVRSINPGPQLLVRVVLPADVNPDTGQPSFVTVAGTIASTPDRWQKLELSDLLAGVEEQARVMRLRDGRTVNLQGAYLERLVLNLYGGAGEAEVFVDDLVVGPVPPELARANEPPMAVEPLPALPPERREGHRVELRRGRLSKDGYPWLFRAIDAPGADLGRLRRAAFDVWSFPVDDDPKAVETAREAGFLLMPRLDARRDDPDTTLARIAGAPFRDDVVFWELAERLGTERTVSGRDLARADFREVLSRLRERPEQFPGLTTGVLGGEFDRYAASPHVDVFGYDGRPWGGCWHAMELLTTLALHRNLTALDVPQGLYWTTIPMAPPPGLVENIWGPYTPPAWGLPRVQPEQVRVFTYAALMAGYRGLRFQADADLTRRAGRALLIESTLLNAEVDLIESMLSEAIELVPVGAYPPDPPKIMLYNPLGSAGTSIFKTQKHVETSPHSSIRAVGISLREGQGPRGMLVLLANLAPGTQWQPPDLTEKEVHVLVPSAAQSQVAAEISLGGLRRLKKERVPGGWSITLKDFNTTACIILTSDEDRLSRLEAAINQVRPGGVGLAFDQADFQNRWARETYALLVNDQHPLPEGKKLLAKADDQLQIASDERMRGEWSNAWTKSRATSQAVRRLMRYSYDDALEAVQEASNPSQFPKKSRARAEELAKRLPQIITPVSCPPLLSFNTLPEAYLWAYRIRNGELGPNLVEGGSFTGDERESAKYPWWTTNVGHQDEAIKLKHVRTPDPKDKTKKNMVLFMLAGFPDRKQVDQEVPFLDHPPVAVQTDPVRVKAGQLVRIGVKLLCERNLVPGGLGVFVRDSIGGEALQFRTPGAIPDWQEVVLFRQPSEDSDLTVTVGIGAYGFLYVDDIKVQLVGPPRSDAPLDPPTNEPAPAVSNKPAPITRRLR